MPGQERGFTLVELLIALFIATAALIVVSQGVASGLALAQKAARLDQAVSRARSHLTAAEQGHLVAGQQSGDDGGGYRWRTTIRAIETSAPRLIMTPGPTAAPPPLSLFSITATVTWQDGEAGRTVSLATQTIGPAAGPPR